MNTTTPVTFYALSRFQDNTYLTTDGNVAVYLSFEQSWVIELNGATSKKVSTREQAVEFLNDYCLIVNALNEVNA
jgi:hypothetical protein